MCIIFHLSAKLIANHSEIHKVFGPLHQSIITKIKNSVSEDWIAEIYVEHSSTILKC